MEDSCSYNLSSNIFETSNEDDITKTNATVNEDYASCSVSKNEEMIFDLSKNVETQELNINDLNVDMDFEETQTSENSTETFLSLSKDDCANSNHLDNIVLKDQTSVQNINTKRVEEYTAILNGTSQLKLPNSSWSMCTSDDLSYVVFQELLTEKSSDEPNAPSYKKQVISFFVLSHKRQYTLCIY